MSNHILVNSLLEQAIEDLSSSPSLFAVDPVRDFTRNRKLDLKTILKLMLTMENDCMQEEIIRFFGRTEDFPSKSAFFKQRQKLTDDAIPFLFQSFNSKLPVQLYNERYRLFACDGSVANVFRNPNDTDTYFDSPKGASSRGFNQIYINAMYSILDKRYVDLVIQPGRKMNEPSAFRSMVDSIGESESPIIYIGDMNYASYNNIAHVIENGQFFLIRTHDSKIKSLLGRSVDGLFELDCHVDLILSRSMSRKRRQHPELSHNYRYIASNTPFDYIDNDNPEYNISFRIVRFELPNGCFENIITNLPDLEFDTEDFINLYHMRWNEETAYRDIKHVLCLTAFHSKKYKYIVQEVWARAILYNFSTAIITSITIDKKNTVHVYQVNYSESFKTCRHFLRTRDPDKKKMDVAGLIARFLEPVRPGRSFARQQTIKQPFSFCYR